MDSPAQVSISPLRKAAYTAFTTVIVVALLELSLWAIDVQPLSGHEDPYVGFSHRLPLFVEEKGPSGQPVMVTAKNKLGFFNAQSFARHKPPNGKRIFCLGGSTTYGHPYRDTTSFCGWLRQFLVSADPSHEWEVVNAGGISYASYRVTALMEELAAYEPDLFIIYTGQNEFIEDRTYGQLRAILPLLMDTDAVLTRTRLFSTLRRGWRWMADEKPHTELKPEVDERLSKSVGPTSYHRDDAAQSAILRHFRFNLERMVALAHAAGADIAFVTPAVNLKDMPPFKSEHRSELSAEAWARWDASFSEAKAIADASVRLARLDELLKIDDRYAAAHFERGRALLALHRDAEAKSAFTRALEEDIVPLRALPSMQQDVRDVAHEHNVPLVDFPSIVEGWTRKQLGHDIPGKEWFVDHVHLSVEGYRRLALELLARLEERHFIQPRSGWGEKDVARISRQVIDSLKPEDDARAIMTVALVLGWAGQLDEAHRLLLEARHTLGDDLTLLLTLGHSSERRGKPDEAAGFYAEAARAHPEAVEPERRLAELAHGRGDLAATLHFRQEAVRRAPNSLPDRALLAELLAANGEWRDAARNYAFIVEREPENAVAHYNLALALDNLGEADKALATIEKALRLDSKRASYHVAAGMLKERRGDAAAARAAYREAVSLAPDDVVARLRLGVSLARGGALDDAIHQFQEAVRLAPESHDAHFNLGQALRQKGRLVEAQQQFILAHENESRDGAKPTD